MTLAYYGKSKQRQTLLAIVTFFAIAIGVVAAGANFLGAGAAAPQPVYIPSAGAITVDGNAAEWNTTTDFFANMHRAAKADKQIESKLYLRYACATNTLYVLVLTESGVTLEPGGDNFVKIDGTKKLDEDGTVGTYQAVGTTGWEGSFVLAEGLNYDMDVHTQVHSDGEGQTSALVDRSADLDIDCPVVAPAPTVTKMAANPSIVGPNAVWTVSVQNSSQTAMSVVVNDTDASFGSQTSAAGTGNCAESTGNASPFECTVNGSSTLTFTVTKPASNNTCSPTNVSNAASVTYWDGSSSQTTAETTASVIEIPAGGTNCNPQVIAPGITKVAANPSFDGTYAWWEISVQNSSQTSMAVEVIDDDAQYGSQTSAGDTGSCSEAAGNLDPFNCTVNAGKTLKFTVKKAASNLTCSPTNVDNRAQVKWWNPQTQSSQTSDLTPSAEIQIPAGGENCGTRELRVCKIVFDNEDAISSQGGNFTFSFDVEGVNDIVINATEGEAATDSCVTVSVPAEGDVTVTEESSRPSGFVDDSGFPMAVVGTFFADEVERESITVTDSCQEPGPVSETFFVTTAEVEPCTITFGNRAAPAYELEVCKLLEDNGDLINNSGSFSFTVTNALPGESPVVLNVTEGGSVVCETVLVESATSVTVTETASRPANWGDDEPGYPKYDANNGDFGTGSSVTFSATEIRLACLQLVDFAGLLRTVEPLEVEFMCSATFTNRSETGVVLADPKLTVRKVIDFNGDGIMNGSDFLADDWDITVTCPGLVTTDDTGAPFAAGTVEFFGFADASSCTVSETAKAGYTLVKWTATDSGVNSTGGNNSVPLTMNDGDDNVVTFYNRPLGSITVLKLEVNTPANGWTFTLNPSQACGIGSQQGVTAGNGTYTFDNLPLAVNGCSYTVSETVKPNWEVVGGATKDVTGPSTAGGNAQVTFVNQLVVPTCTNCVPLVIVTPTPVPPTPTVVPPTNTPVRPTNTPEPKPTDVVLGERTPGALSTPIAPSTGTGAAGSTSSMNFFMATLGLLIIGAGLATVGVSRKRR